MKGVMKKRLPPDVAKALLVVWQAEGIFETIFEPKPWKGGLGAFIKWWAQRLGGTWRNMEFQRPDAALRFVALHGPSPEKLPDMLGDLRVAVALEVCDRHFKWGIFDETD